jgi:hypothetical protein
MRLWHFELSSKAVLSIIALQRVFVNKKCNKNKSEALPDNNAAALCGTPKTLLSYRKG